MNIRTGQLIDTVTNTLEVSQRVIANLLNMDPHTFSNNRDTLIDQLTPKTKTKIVSIYQVVIENGGLRSELLMDMLQRHIFEDEDGRKDSIVSAIQEGKYSLETLREIAALALDEQRKQQMKKYPDVSALPKVVFDE